MFQSYVKHLQFPLILKKQSSTVPYVPNWISLHKNGARELLFCKIQKEKLSVNWFRTMFYFQLCYHITILVVPNFCVFHLIFFYFYFYCVLNWSDNNLQKHFEIPRWNEQQKDKERVKRSTENWMYCKTIQHVRQRKAQGTTTLSEDILTLDHIPKPS